MIKECYRFLDVYINRYRVFLPCSDIEGSGWWRKQLKYWEIQTGFPPKASCTSHITLDFRWFQSINFACFPLGLKFKDSLAYLICQQICMYIYIILIYHLIHHHMETYHHAMDIYSSAGKQIDHQTTVVKISHTIIDQPSFNIFSAIFPHVWWLKRRKKHTTLSFSTKWFHTFDG